MELNAIIENIKQQIQGRFEGFDGIYFYGSRVKGNFNQDSDIDLIILFKKSLNHQEQLDLAGIIGDIEYDYSIFIDYHPYTIFELKQNPYLYSEVVDKGIYYNAA